MASRDDILEALKRGLITEDQAFEQLAAPTGLPLRRQAGRVFVDIDPGVSPLMLTPEQGQALGTPEFALTSDQETEIQRRRRLVGATVEEAPEAAGLLGSFGAGGRRGFREIGAGAIQLLSGAGLTGPLARAAGVPEEEFEQRVLQEVGTEAQRQEAASRDFPITGQVGRIGGQLAAAPIPATTIPRAIATGATIGALQPVATGEERAINIALGGLAGGVAQRFIPPVLAKAQRGLSTLAQRVGQSGPVQRLIRRFDELVAAPGEVQKQTVLLNEIRDALKASGVAQEEIEQVLETAPIREAIGGAVREATEEGLDPAAAARLGQFRAVGAPATQAQITREFAAAEAEDVARGAATEQGVQARALFEEQRQALAGAVNRFKSRLGIRPAADKIEAGAAVRNTIAVVRDENKAAVRAAYAQARDLVGDDVPIVADDLLDGFETAIDELPLEAPISGAIERALAKFGVITGQVTKKGNVSTVTRPDGSTVRFRGNQEPLTLGNAEKLRQRLNQSFKTDRSGTVAGLIRTLDSVVDDALEGASAGAIEKQAATTTARGLAAAQKRTFEAKDIIGDILGFKPDRITPRLDDDVIIQRILNSPNKVSNVRRIIAAVTESQAVTPSGPAGQLVKGQLARSLVDDIFSKVVQETPDGIAISGNRLNTAMNKAGLPLLRELLEPAELAQLKLLQRVIGDATIPVPRTTNVSGSGQRVVNAVIKLTQITNKIPLVGGILRSTKTGFDEAARDATLEGIRNARPPKIKITPRVIADEEALATFFARFGTPVIQRAVVGEAQ